MTLINYLTRVHFGDGILEEALWAEIERNGKRRPLVVAGSEHLTGGLAERFFAGLPKRSLVEVFSECPDVPTEAAVRTVVDIYCKTNRDLLIAYGRGNAIDLAKLVRIALRHKQPLSVFASSEGGSHRVASDLPDLYAVPGIVGFASCLTSHARVALASNERIEVVSSALIPTVTICDPTLTLGTPPMTSASAGVIAISNCVEAFLSRSYNPPADGIALDGLARGVRCLHRTTRTDDLEMRREMMAAALNGALAQQKGLGVAHAIGNAVDAVSSERIDAGALGRLVLPGVLRFYAEAPCDQYKTLCDALKLSSDVSLADGFETFLSDLPLPGSLKDMGIGGRQICAAAAIAARDRTAANCPRTPRAEDIVSIMQSVR